MKKLFGILILAAAGVYCTEVSAQNFDITYDDIEKFVSVEGNYEALMERMESGNAELTSEDYAHLYYGFSFTDGYVHDLAPLVETAIYEMVEEEYYEQAWQACRQYLDECPFSMFALNLGVFLADHMRDFDMADIYYRRSGHILEVIEASGDGSHERPFQVLHPGDVIYYLRYQVDVESVSGYRQDEKGVDIFEVEADGQTYSLCFAFDLCSKGEPCEEIVIIPDMVPRK